MKKESAKKKSWSWQLRPSRSSARLVGGFSCDLGAEDLNQWHEFIFARDVFRVYMEACDLLEAYSAVNLQPVHAPALNKVVVIQAEQRMREQELYEIGKAWYAELEVRREKAQKTNLELDAERAEPEKDKP